MKPQKRVMEYESTVEGESIGMSIDQGALSHIMSVLTDLYSDPELAVIREYATNAYDAHVEAGIRRPIEVTLPSALSPFFKVRDFGTGLSVEDIREIYSRYGTSTKRESNDVVGMLGLGCKSALTYADQFTVTSTKANRTIQVLVSRDEDGSGSMTIVSDGPAEGEQGTEVIVPAKRHNAFDNKATTFFSFWQEGTVLVNGERPSRVDGLWLSDKILLTKDTDDDYVVMGNVAYPFLEEGDGDRYSRHDIRYGDYSNRFHLVAFVDIGEVVFTPSRESLQATKQTKTTLAELRNEVARLLPLSIQKQVENAASAIEAVALVRDGRALEVKVPMLYKGREVPLTFDRTPTVPQGALMPSPDDSHDSFLVAGRSGRRKVNGERMWTADFSNGTWFEGFTAKQLSPVKREKLQLWAAANKVDLSAFGSEYVYVDALTADEKFWLAGRKVYNWADVDATKIPTDSRGETCNGRPRGSYDAMIDGKIANTQAGDLADADAPIFWTHGNSYSLDAHDAFRRGVLTRDEAIYVALPQNRIEKFCRDFPEAIGMDDAARAAAKKWQASVNPDTVEAYKFQSTHSDACSKIRNLDPSRVDDPDLVENIRLAKVNTETYKTKIHNYNPWLSTADTESKRSNPLRNYPLVAAQSGYNSNPRGTIEHVYLYVNMAYALAQADNERKVAA